LFAVVPNRERQAVRAAATSAAAIVTVRPFPIIVPAGCSTTRRGGAARWNAALIVCGAANVRQEDARHNSARRPVHAHVIVANPGCGVIA